MDPPPVLHVEDFVEVQVEIPTERQPVPMPSTEGASFQEVLLRLASELDDGGPRDMSTVLAGQRAETAETPEVEEIYLDLDGLPDINDLPEEDEGAVPAMSSSMLPAVRATQSLTRVRRAPSTFERTIGVALHELGVPASCVPDIRGTIERADLHRSLVAALRLPKAPALPLGDGAVVAVVGERRAAIDLAEQLADQPALNGAVIKLADRAEFRLRNRSVGNRPSRTVVVVPSEPGDPGEWTVDVLDRLDPELVYGIIPATRKSEDVASWAMALGGLDALALTDVERTVSPAAVLRLGIPVGLLDGRDATAEAWADLLIDRVAIAA
jgi:hypothetical protein